jgi:hypothetical protein
MEPVLVIWFSLIATWLYSACSLVYLPIKTLIWKLKGKDIWVFLSRRRLLLTALAYLISAPLVALFGFLVSAASVGGGHAASMSDHDEATACAIAMVFLAAAVIALALVFIRPRPRSEPSSRVQGQSGHES